MADHKDTRTRAQKLQDAIEDAALEGALEIKNFLGTYRGTDPVRVKRVAVAAVAVSGYTRLKASQNNAFTTMLTAARQSGISPQQTLDIAKGAGLLPATIEAAPLKLAK